VENSTPERMSQFAFSLFLVLLSTFFKELHLEISIASSYDPFILSYGRIFENSKFNVVWKSTKCLKIVNSMLCGSLQSELLSACIMKHVKYYFGGSFGE
jgi:hypothetical protein